MRILLLFLSVAGSLAAQELPSHIQMPTRAELDSITQRGSDLYDYDLALTEGSRSMMRLVEKPTGRGQFVVYHTKYAWIVRFGYLSAAQDTFFTTFLASKSPQDTMWLADKIPFAMPAVEYFPVAARAYVTAAKVFQPVQARPHSHVVIPAENGEWLVYIYPEQTDPEYWPLGGDERFRISADGLHILECHRMHPTIVDAHNDVEPDSGGVKRAANFQADRMDNRPEDSDVFAVLARYPSLPAVVGVLGADWAYEIYRDGRISMPKLLKK